MGYYTVETQSSNGYKKTYRGIKAKNSLEAVDIVKKQQERANRWEYRVYLSKRRERPRPQSNKIRMPWAVLAKRAKRQHFNVLKQWGPLHYHRMTYLAFLPDDHPHSPFKNLSANRFGPYTNALLNGGSIGDVIAKATDTTPVEAE